MPFRRKPLQRFLVAPPQYAEADMRAAVGEQLRV